MATRYLVFFIYGFHHGRAESAERFSHRPTQTHTDVLPPRPAGAKGVIASQYFSAAFHSIHHNGKNFTTSYPSTYLVPKRPAGGSFWRAALIFSSTWKGLNCCHSEPARRQCGGPLRQRTTSLVTRGLYTGLTCRVYCEGLIVRPEERCPCGPATP